LPASRADSFCIFVCPVDTRAINLHNTLLIQYNFDKY
jgi:hypothetical protein